MSLFETLEERLRRRREESQQSLRNTMMLNQRAANTPEEIAGTGIGNLIGALGVKYFGGEEQPTEQDLEMERARKGLFSGAQQNEVTPDGGMRSVPREMSLVDDYNYRADKFLDYAQKYGDKDAFTLGMQFKKMALDETQSARTAAAKLSPLDSLTQRLIIADPYLTVQEARSKAAETLNIELPTTETTAEPVAEQPVATTEDGRQVISGAAIGVTAPVATTTPLAIAPIPIGTNVVDDATVNERVDSVLAGMGLTRETAPPDVVQKLLEVERKDRPYMQRRGRPTRQPR